MKGTEKKALDIAWVREQFPSLKLPVNGHPAAFPRELARRCILLGSRVGDTVLDPFAGSGTTGLAAIELGRKAVLIELNPTYAQMGMERTKHGTQARLEAVNS